MSSSVSREKYSILKSLLAIILIALCLWASQWQYHRGVARHARNFLIETNSSMKPIELRSVTEDVTAHEWQPVTVSGSFDAVTNSSS